MIGLESRYFETEFGTTFLDGSVYLRQGDASVYLWLSCAQEIEIRAVNDLAMRQTGLSRDPV